MSTPLTTTGSCLCGGIAFRVTGELAPIQICHCTQCRKAQGSAFAANLPVAREAFHLDCGTELVTEYESSPGKKRAFCRRCGSPLYSRRDAVPGVLRLRAGLLDEPVSARPAVHYCVADKASWWAIDDELPQWPGAAPIPKP
ncbi:MAG: GFA family protein [Rhizobacter sp.]|nr:GFA family protein [Rhizobacter sp.]